MLRYPKSLCLCGAILLRLGWHRKLARWGASSDRPSSVRIRRSQRVLASSAWVFARKGEHESPEEHKPAGLSGVGSRYEGRVQWSRSARLTDCGRLVRRKLVQKRP